MIYIETPTKDVFRIFATEYYIAAESDILKRTGEDAAFLLWHTTPTLVVGRYQNVYGEVNLKYAEEKNITIVRRMSGGGTMYIDEGGWQFTFITEDKSKEISFTEYLEPIIAALADMGVKAEFSGRNDILVDGRKVSGNSQYKLGGKTVHHGTLLFSTDLEEIVRATTVADYKIISKGIKSVRERVTNISEHMQEPVTADEFKEMLIRHVTHNGRRYSLSEDEQRRIDVIADEKFRNKDAIFGAAPGFSIVKSKHLRGGMVEMHFDVKKGCITDCAIIGDFFATEAPEKLHDVLCGCLYEKDAIEEALKNAGLDGAIYGVSAEELAELLTE